MATDGKVPFLGFQAGAVKFLVWLGFGAASAATVPARIIDLVGEYRPAIDVAGAYAPTVDVTGEYRTTVDVTGELSGD